MDHFILILNIGILLGTVLIGFSLIFLKSYFTKKAENAATKEDIRKITEEVEQVKSYYTADIERLKSALIKENKYHDRMFDAVELLYEQLADLEIFFYNMTRELRSSENKLADDINETQNTYNDTIKLFNQKKIYLDLELKQCIERLFTFISGVFLDYETLGKMDLRDPDRAELYRKVQKEIKVTIPELFREIDRRIHNLIQR